MKNKSSRNPYGVPPSMPENKATQVKVKNCKTRQRKTTESCKLNNSKGSHGAGANLSAK